MHTHTPRTHTAHPAAPSRTASLPAHTLTVSACLNSGFARPIGVLPFCIQHHSPHTATPSLMAPSPLSSLRWTGSPCPLCSPQPQPQSTAQPRLARNPCPWCVLRHEEPSYQPSISITTILIVTNGVRLEGCRLPPSQHAAPAYRICSVHISTVG
jgi:hypothetical protein